jgi:glycosyltransferase involved in cell wall biosynthesis
MRVIHTIANLAVESGGPAQTVPGLCAALQGRSVDALIVTQKNSLPGGSTRPEDRFHPQVHDALPGRRWAGSALSSAHRFGALLRMHCKDTDPCIIHDHGLWLASNHVAAVTARKLDVPLIVSPRGMLEPWAFRHRAWKKQLAWLLYQRRDLRAAMVLHATADQEAGNLRRRGLRMPIAVIPNGVPLPDLPRTKSAVNRTRIALFLSRINPKKGLLVLVEAWRQVQPPGWQVVIAGPDEGGHRGEVEEAIGQAGLTNVFRFVGLVDGGDKTKLYRGSDLFILPTFSENFGVVVAEALAHEVPVITTKGAPWEGLLTHRCGWWVDIGVEPLVAALREATNLPQETLRDMGQRGRAYVEQNFGWPGIAQQMLSVYQWMLGRGPKPDCLYLD